MPGNFSINPSIGLFHSSLHSLHLKINLLFFNPTKQHSELIFIFSIHDLHSILLKIPDMLSTSSDNEVDINLKLSINFSLCNCFTIITFFFNWYRKSDIFFHVFSYTIKFAFKFFCYLIDYKMSIITSIVNYYWNVF